MKRMLCFNFAVIAIVILLSNIGFAGTYWISPTGVASWTSCTGEQPLSGASACSLSTANSNLSAGDIAYLREGIYLLPIYPRRSGSPGKLITYSSYQSEEVAIHNPTPIISQRNMSIWIAGQSYIKVNGILIDGDTFTAPGPNNILLINQGASNIEISNCIFSGKAYLQTYQSSHLWLHNNIFKNNAYVSSGCDDIAFGLQLGAPSYAGAPGYNTLENNVFAYGGHHNLETFTFYNVIRNNVFYNNGNVSGSGCSYGPDINGLYGNRNLQIYDGKNSDGTFNLVEGNRFGNSGPPPDDDGGDGLTITAPKNIIRFNIVFNAQNNGVLFKTGAGSYSDHNRFYNNTIYHSGRYRNTGALWQGHNFRWYGSYERNGNVIKNNILFGYGPGGSDWSGFSVFQTSNNVVSNNWCTDPYSGRCSATGDPLFVNADLSDPANGMLPDLSLKSGSRAIDGGTFLAQAKGTGSNSKVLVVDDALYFQDGSWGSALAGHQADWIAIGTTENVAQISTIDYATNTITLASEKTWPDGAKIWLYQRSDGTRVLYGAAPDYGAHEFAGTTGPAAPTNVQILQ